MINKFDSIIIGSGQAAPSLAVALAKRGEQVALIEGNVLGGSCVNYGCTPTKTLRKSARIAHEVRTAHTYGVNVSSFEIDFSAAMERMRQRVSTSRNGLENWLAGTDGVTIVRGWGSFSGRTDQGFEVSVGERTYVAPHVYINTGTRASIPPINGLSEIPHLDNTSLLELTECPDHLIILGGSYIGLEMGQIFHRLGAKVTIVEGGSRVAGREDEDVSDAIEEIFRSEGIEVVTGQKVTGAIGESGQLAWSSKGAHEYLVPIC
jgi:pyruvate/2-oxoglutarate dehydrogenase complex dihydrolipoamide dehydrogenase (E3) component